MDSVARKPNQHFKRLMFVKEYINRLLFGLFIMLLTVISQLAFPKAISYFIDNAQEEHSRQWYIYIGLGMFFLIVIQAFATALRYYIFESAGLMIVTKIRRVLHAALINQSISFYDKHNIGELTNRLSSDVEMLQDTLTMGFAISLRSACVLFGAMIMLLTISPILSFILLIILPLSLYFGKWAGEKVKKKANNIQLSQAMCAKSAHDNFSNIKLVHAFNGQDKANSLYHNATEKSFNVSLSYTNFLAKFQGLSSFALYLTLMIILMTGANFIASGLLTVGELTSFVIYSAMLSTSAGAVSSFWTDWMRAIGATERIFEIIDQAEIDLKKSESALELQGKVEFKNVDFSYPERANNLALENFNLSILAGEKVALIGPSGAGKSTVVSLLLGFYKVNKGSVLFDNIQMEQLCTEALRENIAIVEQEPSLFCNSIYDNIAYGGKCNGTSMEDVIRVAKLANAHDFISNFPNGYETLVGDRGVQLSGGQKQRVAIARALLRNPKILILDEATSALDTDSEQQVQSALDNLMEGRTTIMIAHRYSTIAKADKVVVLDSGEIIDQGSHFELSQVKTNLYTQLVQPQKVKSECI